MEASTRPIRVAVIGAGLAGQAHAFGYRTAGMAVSSTIAVELVAIADPNLPLARSVAARYGFATATDDISGLLDGDDVDAVSVALPNFLHAELLPSVIASGKHVLAEKPIGRTLEESTAIEALAGASKATTGVGFSFRRLPGLAALKEAVASGRIGDVHTVRGWYRADYASDPAGALSWRYSQERAGAGALLDIGAHAIDALQFVVGPIARVENATLRTVITERPLLADGALGHAASASASLGQVDNDDVAMLTVAFASGAIGQLELSRIASGVPNSLGVQVFGSRGHVAFDSIAASEFTVFESDAADPAWNGQRRVFTGPQHPYFRDVAAMPGGGVGTGYAEAFTAEVQEFLRSVADGHPMDTDFQTATAMMRVVDAALESHRTRRAVELG